MIRRRSVRRPTHSTIVAYLALFTALGGTGYAAVKLPNGSVTSSTIRDRSVKLQDLAPSVRPVKSNRAFRAAVVDTVTDPAANLTINVKSEKGDKGDPGDPSFVPGPTGAPGGIGQPGATGPRGAALGYAHVNPGLDPANSSPNVMVTRPIGFTLYCMSTTDIPSHSAEIALENSGESSTAVPMIRIPPAGSPCAGANLELTFIDRTPAGTFVAVDHAFFATFN